MDPALEQRGERVYQNDNGKKVDEDKNLVIRMSKNM